MKLKIAGFVVLMSLFGATMVRGDSCPAYTGVRVQECSTRISPCVVQKFSGPGSRSYSHTILDLLHLVNLVVIDVDIAVTDTVEIANIDCDGGDGENRCHKIVLDSNAEPEMTFNMDNSRKFSIRGEGAISFYIDDGMCNANPCTRISPRVSGVYNVNYKGDIIQVFCEFRGDHGYVFLATPVLEAHPHIDEDGLFLDRSKALIKFKHQGNQYDAEISQLPDYENISLSVQNSMNEGFNDPRYVDAPFQYLGIVPQSEIEKHTLHGYVVNGFKFEFKNCDGNPNSYFVFYFCANMANDVNPIARGNWGERPWFTHKVEAAVSVPDRFLYCFDMHQGGCGVFHRTTGAALGLRFPLP